MNVLITSASRKVALIQAFLREFDSSGGGRVIATDVDPLSAALFIADESFMSPRSDSPGFVERMLDECATRGVDLLVPTRDEELPVFAAAREEFSRQGTTVAVASSETVALCQDKRAFYEFCDAHDFGHALTYPVGTPSGDIAYPAYVKPRFGKGGKGARRIESGPELEAAISAGEDLIVQAFESAPEFTIDLFADFSSRVISAVPRQRVVVVAGESYVTRTVADPSLVAESVRLAQALGLVAHNTVQCFHDGTTPRFIEVNPRFGGAANLGFHAGAPTPRFLLALLRGEHVESRLNEHAAGRVMLRYTQDIFVEQADGGYLRVPGDD